MQSKAESKNAGHPILYVYVSFGTEARDLTS